MLNFKFRENINILTISLLTSRVCAVRTKYMLQFGVQCGVYKLYDRVSKSFISLISNMSYTPVTHIIFDLDGLLLDTEHAYETVISEIAGKYGKVYTKDIKMKLLGTTEQDTAKIAVSSMELPITPTEFHNHFSILCQTALANAPLMQGAQKLINHFHKNNIPIALATSSSKESVEIKLQKHKELFSVFSHKVMASTDPEVKNGKPHPDIFLICASRFPDKPDPAKCLVFEDAPNGARAAISAGMQVVMVPDPATDRSLCSHATLVLNSLEDFQPQLFGLPPL